MKKSDFETLDAIGIYHHWDGTELYIYSFEKRGDTVRVLYSEYTGYNYVPHIKKVYGMDNEPYFIHICSNIGQQRHHITRLFAEISAIWTQRWER